MTGMNATTGRVVADIDDHIRQSIRDILTTPLGSRIERRDYGSLISRLIDQPGNGYNTLRLMAATVAAIARDEPRIRITAVRFDIGMGGAAVVAIDAMRTDGPRSGHVFSAAVTLR